MLRRVPAEVAERLLVRIQQVAERLAQARYLDVVPQQVVPREPQSANRRLVVQAAMWSMPIVTMQPRRQVRGALA